MDSVSNQDMYRALDTAPFLAKGILLLDKERAFGVSYITQPGKGDIICIYMIDLKKITPKSVFKYE